MLPQVIPIIKIHAKECVGIAWLRNPRSWDFLPLFFLTSDKSAKPGCLQITWIFFFANFKSLLIFSFIAECHSLNIPRNDHVIDERPLDRIASECVTLRFTISSIDFGLGFNLNIHKIVGHNSLLWLLSNLNIFLTVLFRIGHR